MNNYKDMSGRVFTKHHILTSDDRISCQCNCGYLCQKSHFKSYAGTDRKQSDAACGFLAFVPSESSFHCHTEQYRAKVWSCRNKRSRSEQEKVLFWTWYLEQGRDVWRQHAKSEAALAAVTVWLRSQRPKEKGAVQKARPELWTPGKENAASWQRSAQKNPMEFGPREKRGTGEIGAQERTIPKSRKSSKSGRKPVPDEQGVPNWIQAYKGSVWHRSGSRWPRRSVEMLSSLTRMGFRKAKADQNLNLVRHVKGNKKGFCKLHKQQKED